MFDVGHLAIATAAFTGTLAVLLLVVAGSAVLLRRRGRLVTVLLAVVAFLLLPVAVASAANTHYRYLPRLDDALGIATWPHSPLAPALAVPAAPHPRGTVVAVPITGTVSGFGTRTAYVYLPPQYFTAPTGRFPVAYLVHGSPGGPLDWLRAGDAAQAGYALARAGRPVILVAPRMSRSWLDDSECLDRPSEHVATYLTRDVVPAVDRTFRTDADAPDRLLLGISAGGYCALNLGLLHRDEFAAIADLSGLDRPTHSGGLRGLLGPDATPAELAAQTPADYVATLPARPYERIYFASGRSDHGPLADQNLMAAALRARCQGVTTAAPSGDHDYAFWRRQLPIALTWWQDGQPIAAASRSGSIRQNPTCLPSTRTTGTSSPKRPASAGSESTSTSS